VRRIAARVLGNLTHEDVARALAGCLADDDTEVRRTAADSLARVADRLDPFPAEVVDALLERLSDSDRELRLSTVRALGAAGNQAAIVALIDRLGDDDGFVRIEAVRALSRTRAGGREIEALLDDSEPGVRAAAARAVAESGGTRATELLVDFAFAFGGHGRREAGRLLRKLDRTAASERLLDVLDDQRHKRSWQIAIEALDELHRSDLAAADATMARA
jgi:HEAT repeat protein